MVERERILAERFEQRQLARERWERQRMLKQQKSTRSLSWRSSTDPMLQRAVSQQQHREHPHSIDIKQSARTAAADDVFVAIPTKKLIQQPLPPLNANAHSPPPPFLSLSWKQFA